MKMMLKLFILVAFYLYIIDSYYLFAKKNRNKVHFYSHVDHELELAKVFCRIADDYLLLDVPGAGTPEMKNCCHGGCDNCNFSRIFDEMESGKPSKTN